MGLTLTLEQLLERQRIYLQDTDDSEWEDDALVQFLNDAIILYSTQIPYSRSVDVPVAGNEYVNPTLLTDIEKAWGYFSSTSTREFVHTGDIEDGMWQANAEPIIVVQGFPDEGSYYLPREPQGSTFKLLYWGFLNPGFEVDSPDETVDLGSRPWAEMAVRNLTGFLAFSPGASFRALLEQWADKQDLNVDNPLEQEARRYLREYQRIVSLYTGHGAISLG